MDVPSLRTLQRKRNYYTLDGLRGVAALAVASRHFSAELVPVHLPGSYLAVDLFFAMSGFVLAHSYDDRLDRDLSRRLFLRNRLIRVYPLYLLSIVLVGTGIVIALIAQVPMMWSPTSLTISVLLSLLFLPTPQGLTGTLPLFPLNGPAWSLFMEVVVNIVYAFSRRWLSGPRLTWLLCVSGVALAAAVAIHGDADIGAGWDTLAISPPRVLFSFFLGVALFRWDQARRLPTIGLPAWAIPLLMLAVFAAGPDAGWGRTALDMAGLFLLLPLLLIAGIQNQPARLQRVFTFLGVTSYAIYALHVPLQKYLENGLARLTHGHSYAPYTGFVVLIALLPIGWVANRCFDAPVRQWLARRLHARAAAD